MAITNALAGAINYLLSLAQQTLALPIVDQVLVDEARSHPAITDTIEDDSEARLMRRRLFLEID